MSTRQSMLLKLIPFLLLTTAAAPPLPAPDASLTISAYVGQGIPAPDRTWSSEDYARAGAILSEMAVRAPATLPRRLSPRSGALFARLVSLDNLAPMRQAQLSMGSRISLGLGILEAQSPILGAYVRASESLPLDAERVDLLIFQLHLVDAMFPLARDMMAGLDPSDPKLAARQAGYGQMRQGIATILFGTLQTLTEHHAYRTSELLRLAGTLDEMMPVFLVAIPEGARAELPLRLADMSAKESDPKLKQRLTQILQRAKGQR